MKNVVRTSLLLMLTAAVLSSVTACKKRSGPERDMMLRLAGTWTWKQVKTAKPTVIELKMTDRGTYEKRDFMEIGGIRKMLWVRANPVDSLPEPDSADELARMKKERYEPSVETGRYMLALDRTPQIVLFESDKVTAIDRTTGRTQKEQALSLSPDGKLNLGGRVYQK